MFLQCYTFKATMWLWNNGLQKASWYFVTLPKKYSQEIKANYPFTKRGFASVPVVVSVGAQEWKTSLFFSNEKKSYILPIKKVIRVAEKLDEGSKLEVNISIDF